MNSPHRPLSPPLPPPLPPQPSAPACAAPFLQGDESSSEAAPPAQAPQPTPGAAPVSQRVAGRLADGRVVTETTLRAGDLVLSVLDLGGIVSALHGPDRQGRSANVVLGLANLEDHLERNRSFSSLVGRFGNRIAGGRFELDGRLIELPCNNGPHTLHGGPDGFGTRFWAVTLLPAASDGSVAVELGLVSDDGDQGFPGRLQVAVRYTLTPRNEWRIDYRATTDRATVINLTHHAYWNLAGGGPALGQHLTMPASRYAAIDSTGIPQQFEAVDGTPFDFRAPTAIEARLRMPHPQLQCGRGYDHFYVLDRQAPGLAFAARLQDPGSGRVLDIETTEPGLQLYSGNFLDGTLQSNGGGLLRQGDGLCLETQHAPDSPNRRDVPSTVLRPGQVYTSTTVHRLSVSP